MPLTLLWYLRRSPQFDVHMLSSTLRSRPSNHVLLISTEPSDDAIRRTILSLYSYAVGTDHIFPGRALPAQVRVTELN